MNKLWCSSSVILLTCTLLLYIPFSLCQTTDPQSGETTTVTPNFDQNESGETTTTVSSDSEAEEEEPNDYVTRTKYADCQCGITNSGFPIESILNQEERRRESSFLIPTKSVEPFVILGEPAEAREFPWIVAITKKKWDNKQHIICGGSLVNSRFVVTAAHCIKNQPWSRMEVAFNVHNTTSILEDGAVEIRKIRRVIIHPGWNQQTVDNDIGLIELSTPIDFASSSIRPICLPFNRSDSEFDGHNATVAGWGYTLPSGPNSKGLNKVVVPVISQKQCREETIYKDKILDSMICAGYLEGGRDACTNDSGGPLVVSEEGDRNLLVGLVSWGHGCAKRLAPGVYTRVSRYGDWIKEKVNRGDWCQARAT